MSAVPENPLAAARNFYRDQLAAAFRYSRQFSEPRGMVAEQIVDTPEFDRVLGECAAGSLDAARRLGEMALVLLDRVPALAGATANAPGPWWRDLLNYERGWFLQSATTQQAPPWNRPRRGVSALCTNFGWNVPELVERLKTGKPPDESLRRPMTLLFARDAAGKVTVVEVGPAVEKVFRATNSFRMIDQIASTAGVSAAETTQIITALAGVGAILPGMSAEEMTRAIEAREPGG